MKLTLTQAAKELGISRQRVHVLVKQGRIKAKKYGSYYLIESKDLDKFKRSR